jgi:hypothetical protein
VPAAVAILLAATLPLHAEDNPALRRAAAEVHTGLARECEDAGLVEESIREWQAVLANDAGNPEAKDALRRAKKPFVVEWPDELHRKFVAYSRRRAKLTADLAKRWTDYGAERDAAGDRDGAWMAFQQALGYDPDFKEARARLGEKKFDGDWMPEWDAKRREQGLMELGGKWLPMDEVKERRSKWAEAWEVQGAHFHVRCNRTILTARSVLARAEEAYAAFHREILGVVDPPPAQKKLRVYDFATREDMDAHVKEEHQGEPPRDVAGWYTFGEDIAHFGPVGERGLLSRDDIVRHECVHQIAAHAIPMKGWLNARPGFWAWEGVASYFESVEVRNGKILAGDPSHPRCALGIDEVEQARTVGIADFVARDQKGLGKLYQQATVMVHYFLNGEGGKHREKFIAYFKVVASGLCEKDTFETCFGEAPEAFEERWKAYARRIKPEKK